MKIQNEIKDIYIECEKIHNGLIKEIGAMQFSVLIAIASFCNQFNESIISQRDIAKITGLSLPTVNKAINNLLDSKIGNIPIIKRRLINNGGTKKTSVYLLNTNIIKVVR